MQMDVGMAGYEVLHPLGLMGREVVGDDVDLSELDLRPAVAERSAFMLVLCPGRP